MYYNESIPLLIVSWNLTKELILQVQVQVQYKYLAKQASSKERGTWYKYQRVAKLLVLVQIPVATEPGA